MKVIVTLVAVMLVLPSQLTGITTTHHDRATVAPAEDLAPASTGRLNSTERQRRLVPYMTFYLTRNFNRPATAQIQEPREPPPHQYQLLPQKVTIQPYQGKIILANYQPQPQHPVVYQPKVTYSPFSESNKLPGGFTPIRNHAPQPIRVQVINPQVVEKEQLQQQQQPHHNYQQPQDLGPNFSLIFDKLLQMKQYSKQPVQYTPVQPQAQKVRVAAQYFTNNYATPRPETKFIAIDNYTPETRYKPLTNTAPANTYIHTYTPANIDISHDNKVHNYENFESLKTYNQIPSPVNKDYEQRYEPQEAPLAVKIQQQHPYPQPNEDQNYEQIIYRPVPIPINTYHQQEQPATIAPSTENPHSLNVILKQLQDSNTLPQTLTPDNIDNSIKTLVHILNALKQTQKFQRPIVVDENIDEYDEEVPETVTHTYPANTPEGGTPGKPGIDYPAHAIIPQTDFNCKKQRYKGFFGDPDTNCQVWHYCDLNGGQASFLCPNGTIFSQVALTCDWWYNVKCATTTQLYVLNERLYKYILPFTPKFPEDYSGPLVDRYLALKFKEMEEKMKKQKKGKTEKPSDDVQDTVVNTLQDIDGSEAESEEHTTVAAPDSN